MPAATTSYVVCFKIRSSKKSQLAHLWISRQNPICYGTGNIVWFQIKQEKEFQSNWKLFRVHRSVCTKTAQEHGRPLIVIKSLNFNTHNSSFSLFPCHFINSLKFPPPPSFQSTVGGMFLRGVRAKWLECMTKNIYSQQS